MERKSVNTITNKRGDVINLGDVMFVQSPRSDKWPDQFPEQHWMFIVRNIDTGGYIQGPSINWKRKGDNYVMREIDELQTDLAPDNYGMRRATQKELAYMFKRKPLWKKWVDELKGESNNAGS